MWTWQRAAGGTWTPTCAIVTCPPNALMAEIHDRMPVILPADARDEWLDPRVDTLELPKLLVLLAPEELEAYEVSPVVNSPRNDSPECVQPVG